MAEQSLSDLRTQAIREVYTRILAGESEIAFESARAIRELDNVRGAGQPKSRVASSR